MVPPFDENNVTKYFQMFEKVAYCLEWPAKYWTMLLQGVLKGKAQKVYISVSNEHCNNYDFVKDVILKAYELVPEAYRYKFRRTLKLKEQTHVEYASVLQDYLDQWLHSKGVETFKNLRELVMLENFLNHVPKEIATHITDRNAKTVADAAIMADEYCVMHKCDFDKPEIWCKGKGVESMKPASRSPPKVENNVEKCHFNKVKPVNFANVSYKGIKECDYCGKKGHVERECWKKSRKEKQSAKTVALVSALERSESKRVSPSNDINVCGKTVKREMSKFETSSEIQENEPLQTAYSSFMSVGSVSINDSLLCLRML